jgi:hypothetical protein
MFDTCLVRSVYGNAVQNTAVRTLAKNLQVLLIETGATQRIGEFFAIRGEK